MIGNAYQDRNSFENTVICRRELVRESREEAILVAGADMEGRLGSDEAGSPIYSIRISVVTWTRLGLQGQLTMIPATTCEP
jgi:hypothetical protein